MHNHEPRLRPLATATKHAGLLPFPRASWAYHLSMTTIHVECLDSDPSDRSVASDFLLRQEPDEEEDEKEDEGDGKQDDDDDDEGDDGYSE